MKNLASRYKNLSAEERAVYNSRAEKLSLEYKIEKEKYTWVYIKLFADRCTFLLKLCVFCNSNGVFCYNFRTEIKTLSKCKTPAELFVEQTSKSHDEYAKLSLDEKYKYIIKAMSVACGLWCKFIV